MGKENSTPIDFFQVNIKLPKSRDDKVKIFAHGPTNGRIDFVDDTLVRLEVEDVPAETFVEARILFPVDFIPNSNNIVDEYKFHSIMEEELSYIQEIERKQIRRERNKVLFNNLSILLAGIGIIAIYFIFSKLRRSIDIYDMDKSLYPEDCTPAVASYLVRSVVDSTALLATIYDLARKGYLAIEDKGEYKRKINNFKLERLDKPTASLLDHENFLLEWLFDEIGDGSIVTTQDIEKYGKRHSSSFYKSFSSWQKKVKEEAKNKGYFDDKGNIPGAILIVFSAIAFVISIISLVYEAFYALILLFISIFAFIYGIALLFRRSDHGYIQYKKWQDFKKELKLRGDSQDIRDLTFSLDTALIYGLALGINTKYLYGFKDLIPESAMASHWAYWYFATGPKGQNSFQESLNRSFSAGSVSAGSGGGFSSGGGGGAGGGGTEGF